MFINTVILSYNMKITKKITIVGNSLGILIDKPIVNKMKLKKGSFVELDIKKVD